VIQKKLRKSGLHPGALSVTKKPEQQIMGILLQTGCQQTADASVSCLNGVNNRHSFDVELSFGRQFKLFWVGVFPALIASFLYACNEQRQFFAPTQAVPDIGGN
jgi:hypothetical protein